MYPRTYLQDLFGGNPRMHDDIAQDVQSFAQMTAGLSILYRHPLEMNLVFVTLASKPCLRFSGRLGPP